MPPKPVAGDLPWAAKFTAWSAVAINDDGTLKPDAVDAAATTLNAKVARTYPATVGTDGQVLGKAGGIPAWIAGGGGDLPYRTAKGAGAIGDGASHPLSERYATLAAAQVVYRFATALTQEIDACVLRELLESMNTNASVDYAYTPARTNGTGGTIYVEPGKYLIDQTLEVPRRIRFLGSASSATSLMMKPGANCDILRTHATNYWQYSEIAYFDLYGNWHHETTGAILNTAGHGLNLGPMGEASSIHHLFIWNFPGDGFRNHASVGSGIPCNIGPAISSFLNGGSGFNILVGGAVYLDSPSGDGNRLSLIRLEGYPADPVGSSNSALIISPKSERSTASVGYPQWFQDKTGAWTVNDPAIEIVNFGGPTVIVGGTIIGASATPMSAEGSIAVKRSGTLGAVLILGLAVNNYLTFYQDLALPARTVAKNASNMLYVNTIGRTDPVVIEATGTWNNTATIAALSQSAPQYFTVTGAVPGDYLTIAPGTPRANPQMMPQGYVESADIVMVWAENTHATFAATANFGTLYFRVEKKA